MLNVTRQGGKSSVVAIKTLHKAEYNPGALILLLSPSQRQSAELMLKVKEFHRTGDLTADSDTILSLVLPNRSRIVALPGKEGTIRGFSGVDKLVIDEAARVADALYYSVRPMLAVSGGEIELLSTPFGKRGFFFEEWDHGVGWHRMEADATQCPRISAAFLAQERRTMGEYFYSQEYLCQFNDAQTSAFSYEDVQAALGEQVQTWTL
ncbi:MAG: terminase family protein [Chloroflexota bacterium]